MAPGAATALAASAGLGAPPWASGGSLLRGFGARPAAGGGGMGTLLAAGASLLLDGMVSPPVSPTGGVPIGGNRPGARPLGW